MGFYGGGAESGFIPAGWDLLPCLLRYLRNRRFIPAHAGSNGQQAELKLAPPLGEPVHVGSPLGCAHYLAAVCGTR